MSADLSVPGTLPDTMPGTSPDAARPAAKPGGTSTRPAPIDGDWAKAPQDADDQPGHAAAPPDEPADEGVLESLGKAISSPVEEAAEPEDARQTGKQGDDGARGEKGA